MKRSQPRIRGVSPAGGMSGYCSAYTPSVTLRVPAPLGREPFGAALRLTGSLFEGAGWPSGQTEGVSQGDAELYRMSVTAQRVQGEGTGNREQE